MNSAANTTTTCAPFAPGPRGPPRLLGGMLVSFASLEPVQLAPEQAAAYAASAEHEVALAIGRATIAVRFSRASAAAAFAERFGDMLGAGTPDMVAYAVELPGESFFWVAPDRARRWPHRIDDVLLVFFADNVAMYEYFTNSADLGIHAAVLASDSLVAAIVGRSTAGKTTTAIAAARGGLTLYSDERCVIQDGLVVPFLRAIGIREGGRMALLADPLPESDVDARLRALPAEGDTVMRPRVLFGQRAGGPPRPLGALFIIEGRDATPSVEPCSLYAVFAALHESVMVRGAGLARDRRAARGTGVSTATRITGRYGELDRKDAR